MNNATIAKAKKATVVAVPAFESQLRVLSIHQRKTVSLITKDWQSFTFGIYSEMFDKI